MARALVRPALAMFVAASAIAAGAQLTVPMTPVPMTLQSYVVLVVAGLGGLAVGVGAVALYLAAGALGLPVFAKGASGLAVLVGPTGGFLFGFLLVALVVGAATGGSAQRGWAERPAALVAVMALAHALLFVAGVGWLAARVGLERAITAGLVPFLAGAAVKVLAAAATVLVVRRVASRPGRG